MVPVPVSVATLVYAVLCVASDVQSRRIPNLLSGLGMVVGIVLNTVYFGSDGLLASLGGTLLIGGLLLGPFAMGGIGGGDVKMMAAIGALLGPRAALPALLMGLVFGGGIMVIHLIRLGRLREKLLAAGTMAAASVLGGTLEPLRISAAQPGAITLPYSVPLTLGTLVVLVLGNPWA